jgi:EF hand
MTTKTLCLTFAALLLSVAGLPTFAADEPTTKPTADQGTSMPQPDKAAVDQNSPSNQAAKPAAGETTAQMKSLDTDSDGTISKAEAGKMRGLSDGFDVADKNKDGKLDAGEFATALSQVKK